MATKTQEYLKALAGQRTLPEDVCCTTLTQDLIIDATERVNTLQEELDRISEEEFTFTLVDNTVVTKKIAVYDQGA